MPVTVAKENGVTVVKMETTPNNALPPLCQIILGFCYSPMCCAVKKGLTQKTVYAALGSVQIMLGLFNIAHGPGRTPQTPTDITAIGAPYWLGCVYVLTGVITVFAGRFSSYCMVGISVMINLIGSIFAITGFVLYFIEILTVRFPIPSLNNRYGTNVKHDVKYKRMITTMDITMTVCAFLQMMICLCLVEVAVKAIKKKKKEEQDTGDIEIQQPESEGVPLTTPGV